MPRFRWIAAPPAQEGHIVSATSAVEGPWSSRRHYPMLLLGCRAADAVEIIDLDEVGQAQLMTEVSRPPAR